MSDALNAVDVVPDGLPERCGVHIPLSANSGGVERGRGEGGRKGREGRDESEPRKGRRGGEREDRKEDNCIVLHSYKSTIPL